MRMLLTLYLNPSAILRILCARFASDMEIDTICELSEQMMAKMRRVLLKICEYSYIKYLTREGYPRVSIIV